MPKCDFNKVAKQFNWNLISTWAFPCKFAVYFQNTFFKEHLWMAASEEDNIRYKIGNIGNVYVWFVFDNVFLLLVRFLDIQYF